MPQSKERKREYMRGFMRRRRLLDQSQYQGLTNRGNVAYKSEDVSPSVSPSHRLYRSNAVLGGLRLDEMTPQERARALVQATIETSTLTAKATPGQVMDYVLYLQARSLRAVETSRGYELVDLATGELWLQTTTQETIYQQQPTTRTLRDDVLELAQRVTILEAERVLREAI